MTTTPTADTPERWGAASRGYADKVAPLLMRAFADELVDRLNLDPSMHVVEVGAGSGAITEVLAPKAQSVLATDYAPEMIEVLQERLDAGGITNVRCRVMDGQALELADDSFDAAACAFALMLFPDRGRGFAELCRVVRPGGRTVVSGWAGPDRFEAFGLFLAALQAAFPDMPPPASPPPVFSLADPLRFKEEMEAAGFADVEVDFVSRTQEVSGFDRVWEMFTVGAPPVQMLFDRVGPSGKARIRESLRTIVEDRFGSGPVTATNVATVGVGAAT